MPETMTLNKLIILFMLDKVDFPLSKSQISDFILGKGYTTFFKFQEALSDLEAAKLICAEQTHSRTIYRLTSSGRDAIKYFAIDIAPEIRSEISDFLKEKGSDLKEESSIKSDYHLIANGEFEVRCLISEKDQNVVDLKLIVPTRAEAESICAAWTVRFEEIYSLLLSKLL